MKFDARFGDGEVHFERDPMPWERFQAIMLLVYILAGSAAFAGIMFVVMSR